jgi:hypothetical protein
MNTPEPGPVCGFCARFVCLDKWVECPGRKGHLVRSCYDCWETVQDSGLHLFCGLCELRSFQESSVVLHFAPKK